LCSPRCCAEILEEDLPVAAGDLHSISYFEGELMRDPVFQKNLKILRDNRGEEKYKYYAQHVPDGLSKDDFEAYINLKVLLLAWRGGHRLGC
jgi:hypothetical protein